MIILGIETSCDETAVGILEIKKTKAGFFINPLSNVVASQIKIHRKYGGVVPMLASREHTKNISIVTKKALKQAFISEKSIDSKIDLIAVTKGPGLILSLLIGVNFAKTLAWKWNKPIIGINHLEGHLHSFLLPQKTKSLKQIHNTKYRMQNTESVFPSICLLVSGGNTQLIHVKGIRKYKIIGETRDDAAGECFDKGARILGLSYPGGPSIAAEAAKYKKQDTQFTIRLPRPMIDSKNYDFSFSGLKTALLYLTQDFGTKKVKKYRQAIACEFQEAIVDVLIRKTIKAAKEFKTKSIILAGGVSANKRLKEKFQERLKEEKLNIKLLVPRLEYATDNAIMIALAGFFQYIKHGKKFLSWKRIKADANLRLR
jgi:N6-L-threonylcarbamoyladenine synthase